MEQPSTGLGLIEIGKRLGKVRMDNGGIRHRERHSGLLLGQRPVLFRSSLTEQRWLYWPCTDTSMLSSPNCDHPAQDSVSTAPKSQQSTAAPCRAIFTCPLGNLPWQALCTLSFLTLPRALLLEHWLHSRLVYMLFIFLAFPSLSTTVINDSD